MPNIQGPFPAVVLEMAPGNESLGVRTVLDNLSANDFSLQLDYPVELGEKLLVITQLSQAILMLRGEVTAVRKDEGGGYELSVSITHNQIFSSLTGNPSIKKFSVKDSSLKDSGFSEAPLGFVPSS